LIAAGKPDLCLDFTGTQYWRGSTPPTETLHGFDDLLAWCGGNGMPGEVVTMWREHPALADAAFREAIDLRESAFQVFSAAAAAIAPPTADMERLNAALAAAPARTRLQRIETGFAWRIDRLETSVSALLAPVLWSAGDLLTGGRLERVRQCANPKCRWLFLDDSKSGTRRWCAMSMCGNRAKAHRHYQRSKAG